MRPLVAKVLRQLLLLAASVLIVLFGARVGHALLGGSFTEYVNLCIAPSKVVWQVSPAMCDRLQGSWDSVRQVCHPTQADCWEWAEFWRVLYGPVLSLTNLVLLAAIVVLFLALRGRARKTG